LRKEQILGGKEWKLRNPYPLLVGMQISAIAMESTMEALCIFKTN
jgi:hypothetical protein